jgi:acetoacetyl-CoA synthetase
MGEIIWEPTREQVERTRLWEFMEWLPHRPRTYQELWEWSTTELGPFWQAVWDFCGVIASEPADRPLGKDTMPGAEWFPGARLNFAENLLRRADDSPAIIAAGEGRETEQITWAELNRRVARTRRGLLTAGVASGDRVAALVPNGPEAIIGMLASASIGALWSSCSPDFGAGGVVDRFGQIEPKVLIAADGYRYGGKEIRLERTLRAVLDELPGVEQVVVIPFAGTPPDLGDAPVIGWAELEQGDDDRATFAQLPFDYPLNIMYSSGTTGPPKSIVHRAGGVLLKHLCEHQLTSDIGPGDRTFWFTTCGWMMWNWLTGTLASEATVVLYDGSPAVPDLGTLWRLAESSRITHFGVSPKYLATNAKEGIVPREIADLSSLRWVGSTGAPLNPEQFDWVYDNVADDVVLSSITGGTDLVGVFAGGVPILPTRRGEISARWLGIALDSYDALGNPLIGRKGEMVCTRPFPTMPLRFWDDPDGNRYRDAYFTAYPGVWTHGDYVEIRPEGGLIVYGRSDTTLNPGGVRIGTAEIYRAVEQIPEVVDSIVVGRDVGDDQEVVLFVRLTEGTELDDVLRGRIRSEIRTRATPRHVPHHVFPIADVPYTISGKKVEKAVRQVLAGEDVLNRDALVNPESLDLYRGFFEE